MVVEFVDAHKEAFGVEPICRVLTKHGCKIAPSTYYAHRSRPPSPRALRDAELLVEIERVYHDRRLGRGLYGAEKVWLQLHREGIPVARCTVETVHAQRRVAWRAPWQAVRHHPAGQDRRPAGGPGQPPVPCRSAQCLVGGGFHVCAYLVGDGVHPFVSDVFSRRIVGWRTASSMPTELPLDALEMALWIRARAGQSVDGVIHHSDYAESCVMPRIVGIACAGRAA